MIVPGRRNLITDVEGLRVGNASDTTRATGSTVVLADTPLVAGVDVRGGAPGTRETELLSPSCLVEHVDAVVLSGGSAFGLDAAAGVMDWLDAAGRGFAVGPVRVPIVPAAILFDLLTGGAPGARPDYRALGRAACEAASERFDLGNAGAGMGASAGALKGGLGSASLVAADGLQIGAVMAANGVGEVVAPGTDRFYAGLVERGDEFGARGAPAEPLEDLEPAGPGRPGANTTIGVVATNAALDKAAAQRIAIMAHDGIARAVRPAHTPFDGDAIFVVSTGRRPLGDDEGAALARLGALAADCVARAIARGVYAAEPLGGLPSYRSHHG